MVDVATRYPAWTVRAADLGGLVTEVLCWAREVILIEAAAAPEVQRSSLAHAVAHLDLGHASTMAGFFENREEAQADRLASGRLIPLTELARAVAWSQDRGEIASLLGVDLPMLAIRESGLSSAERRYLRRIGRAAAVPA